MHIEPEQGKRLKVLVKEIKGSGSVKVVLKMLKIFVKDNIHQYIALKKDEDGYKKQKELFDEYLKFGISERTLARFLKGETISEGGGNGTYRHLNEIIDLFLEVKSYRLLTEEIQAETSRTDFSRDAGELLSEAANEMCSFKGCRIVTAKYDLGEACLIYGLKQGDRRYDATVKFEYDDIANGIWLCATHAKMIREDNGKRYPAVRLMEWKNIHEKLIDEVREGTKKIYIELHGDKRDGALALQLLEEFDAMDILYGDYAHLPGGNIRILSGDIMDLLLRWDERVFQGSFLYRQISGIYRVTKALRKMDDTEIAFDAWKKILGLELAVLAGHYDLSIPARLQELTPIISPE